MQGVKRNVLNASILVVLFTTSLILSGCAAALIAGGVAGGYVIAQHVEVKPKEEKKAGFFK